jgi:pimeloyl-ACP methyl ester carboxylesterase
MSAVSETHRVPEKEGEAGRELAELPKAEWREVELHGHKVGTWIAGSGPVIGLIHGIASTSDTWREVMPRLAENHTVIAPDMIGHGRSAKPKGDYSLGAYASGLRDLMAVLGYEGGTVVGHSLGGGVAMQFAYQFPEYTERLVLISSGGLGREVNPVLRAATLPGSELVIPVLAKGWVSGGIESVTRAIGKLGIKLGHDLAEVAASLDSLADPGAREAFINTARATFGLEGQRISARDRLYLAEQMPTLIVWGSSDRVIPAKHGRAAHEEVRGSVFIEIDGAGHWPMLDEPQLLTEALSEFIESTEPYEFDMDQIRETMRRGASSEPPGYPPGD